jgi:low affinity Fe/Cu permease
MTFNELFRKFAAKVAIIAGSAKAFSVTLLIIIVWALLGPAYNYSDAWQLFINTSTTVLTLLMVFIIQNTQNRDSKTLHIKIDELLRKTKGTSSVKYLNIEELPDEEIEKLQEHFRKLQARYTKALEERRKKQKKSSPVSHS